MGTFNLVQVIPDFDEVINKQALFGNVNTRALYVVICTCQVVIM